ncbi:MAG: helix-turn-helix domain-containing protein, partial [Caulobacteraceae bacterium]
MEALGSALESILAGDVFAPLDAAELAETEPALERLGTLTPAQLRILMDLQRGRLNKQIAFDVGVTEATVKSHLTAIFRKLGVVNRTQAVLAVQSLMEDAA